MEVMNYGLEKTVKKESVAHPQADCDDCSAWICGVGCTIGCSGSLGTALFAALAWVMGGAFILEV